MRGHAAGHWVVAGCSPGVTTQHEIINAPIYADTVCDRLLHNAQRSDRAGDSLRRTKSRSATKD